VSIFLSSSFSDSESKAAARQRLFGATLNALSITILSSATVEKPDKKGNTKHKAI
jgi:hypothetical protein